jgi:hypothetical protein
MESGVLYFLTLVMPHGADSRRRVQVGSDKILTTLDEINHHIASEPATPRPFSRPLKFRQDRLKPIEAHIRTRDLKARKSVTMAQVAGGQEAGDDLKMVAWM